MQALTKARTRKHPHKLENVSSIVRRLKSFGNSPDANSRGGYGPAIWRSHGASRNLGTDIYKDFAPTERDSRSPKSRIPVLSFLCALPSLADVAKRGDGATCPS